MRVRTLFFGLLALSLGACAGISKKSSEESETTVYEGVSIQEQEVESERIPEQYGPLDPSVANDSQTQPASSEPEREEAKLCLVLGPGMARAIAHAAVLEAIQKTEIPVHCVVGSEMGAVVGALFAHAKGNANSLQWQLFKFRRDDYLDFPLLSLGDSKASGRKLNDFLREIFRDQKIESLPIRFGASATEPNTGAVRFLESGDLTEALSASLALPGVFQAWSVDGVGDLVSGAVSSPAPIELARKLGGNFFVVVDVIGEGDEEIPGDQKFRRAFATVRNLMRLQRKEAHFVIQVKTRGIHFDDFSRQGEILAAGAQAAESNVAALKSEWERAIAEQGAR